MSAVADRFLELHRPGQPLLLPNPWDAGSGKLLESLGFEALATTSSGFAATLGRRDGNVSRDEALANAASIVEAVDVPVSADFEDCYAEDVQGVAETVRLAIQAGLAGCSIEDWDRERFYSLEDAIERVRAAADAAHSGPERLVLTARCENHVHQNHDLDGTIERLRAFEDAGADVLFAPGLKDLDDIKRVAGSVGKPVNVLARPGAPTVKELASVGVARISVGGGFAFAALGAVVEASRELREEGTYGFWENAGKGAKAAFEAFE